MRTWALRRGRSSGALLKAGALVLQAGAILYLSLKVFVDIDTVDFKYIHLAGLLWQDGVNPYSEAYREAGERLFAGLNQPEYLLYPPHWWVLARASAYLPYDIAGQIWRISMAVWMIAGSLILHTVVHDITGTAQPWRTWLMLIFATTISATAIALSLGQTSCLLFLGVCLYVRAYVSGSRAMMGLAIVLVLFKPNFGLALTLFLLPSLFWWPSLIAGAIAVLLLSLPAMLPFDAIEVIRGYVHAVGQWETLPPNVPHSTTGLRYLVSFGFGLTLPGKWIALAAAALALCFGAVLRHRQATPSSRAAMLGFLLAGLIFVIPLHTYDMMLMIPLIALCAALPWRTQVALILPMLLSLRPNNIAQGLGLTAPEETYFAGSGLMTVLLLVILLVWAAGLWTPSLRLMADPNVR